MMQNNQKIPEGWSVKKLSDLCSKISDGIHTTPKYVDKSEYHFINGNNLRDGHICIYEDTKCVSFEEYIKQKQKLGTHTLLMSINGTIGSLANYYNEDVVLGKSAAFMNFNDMQTKKYVYTILQTNSTKRYFENELTGSTIKNLSLKSIKSMKILLPPLPEQEKIAGILGTWDEAIEKLSNLIEQKKLLKKGLMQKLLTGKTRLSGFTQPWKEVKLGEIFNIKKGQGLSKEVLDDNGLNKCILYGELYTKYSEVIKDVESRTNQCEGILSQIGDILIPASTTTTGIDLANATSLLKEKVLLGGDINILRAKKEVSSIFFAYLLTHAYKFDIAKLAQGITIIHLYGEFLKNMKIYIPSDTSEQQAIADVLSTADDEINLLNQKLEALKEQKKGLMQQLLTGQIRVKVN